MIQIPENLYNKLEKISKEVLKSLHRKGIIVPMKTPNGSIRIGGYTILKNKLYYQIVDFGGEIVVDQINLPQSALLLANSLASGKFIDSEILKMDRAYGYAFFEEELFARSAKKNISKNIDKAQMAYINGSIKKYKKEQYKREILKSFEKLKNFA